jgi:hypothetical protein
MPKVNNPYREMYLYESCSTGLQSFGDSGCTVWFLHYFSLPRQSYPSSPAPNTSFLKMFFCGLLPFLGEGGREGLGNHWGSEKQSWGGRVQDPSDCCSFHSLPSPPCLLLIGKGGRSSPTLTEVRTEGRSSSGDSC